MDDFVFRKTELDTLRERINKELLRRRTFPWFDPLASPEVGQDKTSIITDLSYTINNPSTGHKRSGHQTPGPNNDITDSEPSSGNASYTNSMFGPTRNSPDNPNYGALHGDNPANDIYTSSMNFDYDELRNYLHGLSKIADIDKYYGGDEVPGLAFRDPQDIEDKLSQMEKDIKTVRRTTDTYTDDPNAGKMNASMSGTRAWVYYPANPPSGEFDGDSGESNPTDTTTPNVSPGNFYDDYCGTLDESVYQTLPNPGVQPFPYAQPDQAPYPGTEGYGKTDEGRPAGSPNYDHRGSLVTYLGNSDFHPNNPHLIPIPDTEIRGPALDDRGHWQYHDNPTRIDYPGTGDKTGKNDYNRAADSNVIDDLPYQEAIRLQPSYERFGPNPRNPGQGNMFRPMKTYEGVQGTCNVACTGLCYTTCDSVCGEGCDRTCQSRCGDACTAHCGENCRGCTSLCEGDCRTGCSQSAGYACRYMGSMAKIPHSSNPNGNGTEKRPVYEGGVYKPGNSATYLYTSCYRTCQWSCEFYSSSKSTCWDTSCMTICVTSCNTSCLNSCYGGCINNPDQNSGKSFNGPAGGSCVFGCTHNCSGDCQYSCESGCSSCDNDCGADCSAGCASQCQFDCSNECSACGSDCTHDCGGGGDDTVEEDEEDPFESPGRHSLPLQSMKRMGF